MRYPSSCTVSRKFWVSDCQGSSTEKSGAPKNLLSGRPEACSEAKNLLSGRPEARSEAKNLLSGRPEADFEAKS